MKPLLLVSTGDDDADFLYATRFPVEESFYFRFEDGDDLLMVPTLELGRAKEVTIAKQVIDRREAGWEESRDTLAEWAKAAAAVLSKRKVDNIRISPRLPVVYYEALKAAGVQLEIDKELFQAERRHKSREEASFIHAAQRAAPSARPTSATAAASAASRSSSVRRRRPIEARRRSRCNASASAIDQSTWSVRLYQVKPTVGMPTFLRRSTLAHSFHSHLTASSPCGPSHKLVSVCITGKR